jgi:hypothetical protein
MFSIFSREKKILGLHITEEFIRYALVSKSAKENKVISLGEEKIARVEPRNALLSALRNVLRKTGQRNAHLSFPPDFVRTETVSVAFGASKKDVLNQIEFRLKERLLLSHGESVLYFEKFESVNNKDFYNVFISSAENVDFLKSVFVNSGLSVKKIISTKDALLASCVKTGEIVNTMVLNADTRRTDIAVFSPFNRFREISSFSEREKVPSLIKDTYQDFYNISGDKVGYFFVCGLFAKEPSFINFLSRETRLPVQEADVFCNFYLKSGEVPVVTREESLVYAVALGSAIS